MSKRHRPTAKDGKAVVRALLRIRADAVSGDRTETRIHLDVAPNVTVAECRQHGLPDARREGNTIVVTWAR